MARLQISVSSPSVTEGQGSFNVTFTLIPESNDPVGVTISSPRFRYSLGNGPGANPADWSTPTSGFVTLSTYGASETVTLTPISDGVTEPNENFAVLTNQVSPLVITPIGGNPTLVNISRGAPPTGTIIDECFLAGTNILTIDGSRAVEELEIGDKVKTFDGKIEEVKWIGKQTRHRFTAHPTRSLPIQIKAGALGNGLPTKDLHVSPDHALLVEGLLINAGALVNDISIVKTYPEQYVYYHVELENHSLLVAEGAPAESFFPNQEDRALYDNGAEYEELYPHGSKLMLFPMDYPRVSSYNKVPRYVRQKLMQIAEELYPQKVA